MSWPPLPHHLPWYVIGPRPVRSWSRDGVWRLGRDVGRVEIARDVKPGTGTVVWH
jgi:hypothetical protein